MKLGFKKETSSNRHSSAHPSLACASFFKHPSGINTIWMTPLHDWQAPRSRPGLLKSISLTQSGGSGTGVSLRRQFTTEGPEHERGGLGLINAISQGLMLSDSIMSHEMSHESGPRWLFLATLVRVSLAATWKNIMPLFFISGAESALVYLFISFVR